MVANYVSWLQMDSVWGGKWFLIIFSRACGEMDGTFVPMQLFP